MLRFLGYKMLDRLIGFDLEGAKFVIKHLAEFHAIPIALKLKKPDVFENKVKKNCLMEKFISTPQTQQNLKPPEWLQYVAQDKKCEPYYEILCKILSQTTGDDFFKRPHAEPFSTIAHSDLWINNTLHIEGNGKLLKTRFVDFQLYQYGSGICDLVHFIFGSCQCVVSRDHFDELLKYYHTIFIGTLDQLGCDKTEFEFDKFLERVDVEAPAELLHTLYIEVIIKGRIGEASMDVKDESFKKEGAVTQEARDKIVHDVYEFGKKGWIK